MVSPIHSKHLYADEAQVQGISDLKTSAVDLERYPDVIKVTYWEAVVEQGDCVYIPQMWWQQISSRYESFCF